MEKKARYLYCKFAIYIYLKNYYLLNDQYVWM